MEQKFMQVQQMYLNERLSFHEIKLALSWL